MRGGFGISFLRVSNHDSTSASRRHRCPSASSVFFFNDTATTEIYTLSLHDALPIFAQERPCVRRQPFWRGPRVTRGRDRKSTRLNSSHSSISYAVFCLKKKKID